MPLGLSWSVALFASPAAAAAAAAALDGREHNPAPAQAPRHRHRRLVTARARAAHPRVVQWAAQATPLRPACGARPAAVDGGAPRPLPPGAELRLAFVSEAEAAALLAALPPRSAMTRLRQRSVAHYGRAYDYEAFALQDAPAAPWPAAVAQLLAPRLAAAVAGLCAAAARPGTDAGGAAPAPLTQLTVNAYAPGDGIAPHVDAPQAFGDVVAILSLGTGGVTMEFARLLSEGEGEGEGGGEGGGEDLASASASAGLASASLSHLNRQRASAAAALAALGLAARQNVAHVFLPPRSLLLLSGEARYEWTHAIAPRATDVVDGEVRARGERVSLTFRSVAEGGAQAVDAR